MSNTDPSSHQHSTQAPLAKVGDVAFLTVKSVIESGAFLDWGLAKDLFVPRREQDKPMQEKCSYVVCICEDKANQRVYASSKLHRHLSESGDDFAPRQQVDLLIASNSELGYKAVINNSHLGLIFKDEVISPLHIGQRLSGFIKRIRDDDKIDLCFQFHDKQARLSLTEQIIEDLKAHGGISTLTDKSSPEAISQRFGVSKGAYKKALGTLYKQHKIQLSKDKIILVK